MNRMKLLAVLILFTLFSVARGGDDDIIIGKSVTIHSTILDEERSLMVYLPPNYKEGTKKYPVLYLLDGRAHFFHGSGIVEYLSRQGQIPQMIVVAVANVDRTRDFTPTHVENRPTTGGAENFLSFLDGELIPYVDNQYRTANFRVLMGHSLGGLFATYSLFNNPKLFNAYIAISPALQYDDNFLVKQAKSSLKSNYRPHKFFYMTVGYEIEYFKPLEEFYTILKKESGKSIDFEYTILEKENHGSVPHLSIYNGLKYIFSGFLLPPGKVFEGLEAIDAHFSSVSAKYGYSVKTPELTINQLGYRYLQINDYENAIRVFIENVKRYPKSANVYDSLGDAYERNKQMGLAETNYQKAYELGMQIGHPNTAIYHTNLLRVQKKN